MRERLGASRLPSATLRRFAVLTRPAPSQGLAIVGASLLRHNLRLRARTSRGGDSDAHACRPSFEGGLGHNEPTWHCKWFQNPFSRRVYDTGRNTGFVNVDTDYDTGALAVASIRGWWHAEGRRLYPRARHLLITADGGGSNRYCLRQWKMELQRLADQAHLAISVCHFPPGTSKWNKVEHRLFSFISSNWRGEPLRDYETIVLLIARTTTAKGLRVTCHLDRRRYPTGRTISDDDYATMNLRPHASHGEWNYSIHPHENKLP